MTAAKNSDLALHKDLMMTIFSLHHLRFLHLHLQNNPLMFLLRLHPLIHLPQLLCLHPPPLSLNHPDYRFPVLVLLKLLASTRLMLYSTPLLSPKSVSFTSMQNVQNANIPEQNPTTQFLCILKHRHEPAPIVPPHHRTKHHPNPHQILCQHVLLSVNDLGVVAGDGFKWGCLADNEFDMEYPDDPITFKEAMASEDAPKLQGRTHRL
jgi:hypothetical protein